MCLISYVPAGKDKYSEEFIEAVKRGAVNNVDGYGYMYHEPGENKIHFNKKFLSIDNLLKELKEKNLSLDSKLVIHSRTGNKGLKDTFNAHPFIVSESIQELLEISGVTDKPTLVHNGTFYGLGNTDINSDTYRFVKDFLAIPEILALLKRDEAKFKEIFDLKLGLNKVIIFFPDGKEVIIGKFLEDNGYFHSNECYKSVKVKDIGGSSNWEDWRNRQKDKPSTLNTNNSSKNNEFGINISNFTRDEIYLQSEDLGYNFSLKSLYIIDSYEDFTHNPRTVKLIRVASEDLLKLANNKPIQSSISYYPYTDTLCNKFVIRPREEFKLKYLNYSTVVTAIGKLSGKRVTKILKAYNNSKADSNTVILKLENKVYHLDKVAYELFLFENFKYLKEVDDHHVTKKLEDDYEKFCKSKSPFINPNVNFGFGLSDDIDDEKTYAYMGEL